MPKLDNAARARAMTRIACIEQAKRIKAGMRKGDGVKAYEYLKQRGFSHEAAYYVLFENA